MSCSALILAAHGSRQNGAENAQVHACAADIAADKMFGEVAVAFHHGEPTFATVLDTLEADDITIVPFFSGNGYFCDTVLPRDLTASTRFGRVRMRLTQPIGTHPGIVRLGVARISHILAEFGLTARETSLIVVGHGTRRHSMSRRSARAFAAGIGKHLALNHIEAAFLDDTPSVQDVCSTTHARNILAIPFLIGASHHATIDVPVRLGLNGQPERGKPVYGHIDGRLVVCDIAVGQYAEIVSVLRSLVRPFSPSARVGRCREVVGP